VVSKLI